MTSRRLKNDPKGFEVFKVFFKVPLLKKLILQFGLKNTPRVCLIKLEEVVCNHKLVGLKFLKRGNCENCFKKKPVDKPPKVKNFNRKSAV